MTVHARIARQQPATEDSQFAHDVLAGLTARPKRLLPKYFYDQAGAQLFEEITALPEYYPTCCELAILREHAAEIAGRVPDGAALIEFGSGSSKKARILLAAAQQAAAYVPVDISTEMLAKEAQELRRDHPRIKVLPIETDFTKPFRLPAAVAGMPRTGFFPGSTIGNFEPHEACSFLRHAGRILGKGAVLIIGVDLVKDTKILNAAYDDAAGVTAKFNLNLLTRINRELDGTFDLESFSHEAFYNSERHRIEMHLASKKRQKVRVCGRAIDFRAGETIHTENSYKYTLESFGALARGSGWTPAAVWTDKKKYFSVQALIAQDE
ncbi:MAG: L-histidine N(alpha)-methyltransferase [Xanthobacteraceae bacterium]|jgi:L-histidine Nalpha-methyltransferase